MNSWEPLYCTGAWAADIAHKAQLSLPLCAMKHSYVVTESMPSVQGLPNIRDGDSSIYIRIYKDQMFVGGFEHNPAILEEVRFLLFLVKLFSEVPNLLTWY